MKYDNTHLTLQERQIIQKGIESRSSKTAIAQTIGKDPTTVAKEFRKHRDLKRRNAFNQELANKNQEFFINFKNYF